MYVGYNNSSSAAPVVFFFLCVVLVRMAVVRVVGKPGNPGWLLPVLGNHER